MTDEESAARRFYPGHGDDPIKPQMSQAPVRPPAASKNDPPKIPPGASDRPGEPRQRDVAEKMYGDGPEVPESYEAALGSLTGSLEFAARYDAKPGELEQVLEAKAVLPELLETNRMGDQETRDLVATFKRYAESPLAPDRLEAMEERTMAELRREWGPEFDKRLAGAKRVAAEAERRIPGLAGWFEAGAGNDVEVIRQFAESARRRGW